MFSVVLILLCARSTIVVKERCVPAQQSQCKEWPLWRPHCPSVAVSNEPTDCYRTRILRPHTSTLTGSFAVEQLIRQLFGADQPTIIVTVTAIVIGLLIELRR
uniref:Secreted protein n=1 Tax=Anopheles culicifacies TaxID=139723 RepID=A0A182MSJ4_9DIPT